MRLAIVTPVRNGEEFIADTIRSVVSQAGVAGGPHSIDYLIWDAASTDSTRKVAEETAGGAARVISRADRGMYDGLTQAFQHVTGDVYCYLNAGDMLQPNALSFLGEAFSVPDVQWLCGLHLYYASSGRVVGARLPLRYRSPMIRRGYYGRGLPSIQQESTFWSASLMTKVDMKAWSNYKLAGDFYLWHTFAQWAEPRVAQVALGGFRYHGGHLSEDRELYGKEMEAIAGKLRPWDRARILVEKVLWHLPHRLTAPLAPSSLRYAAGSGWRGEGGEIID